MTVPKTPVDPAAGKPFRWKDKEFMLIMLLLLIVAITSSIIITVTVLSAQKPSCPASCDDGNPCTVDYCDKDAGKCVQTAIDGASGSCSGPAGECRVKTCVSGSCAERVEEGCCGNGECEAGEDYLNCLDDCPAPETEVNCTDGLDEDLDGLIDCLDPDCECVENCTDGGDNDQDGLIDCADPDCECNEVCDNGVDDDTDGLSDCCDPECKGQPDCEEGCDDGEDNDCDGRVDCDDPDCEGDVACKTVCGHEDFIMINEFNIRFGHEQMGEWEDECEAVPQGEFRAKVSEVSCYTHANPYMNCTAIENETRFIEMEEFCEELEAKWRCQNNYLGCICNKKPPAEVEEEQTVGCEDAPVYEVNDWFECTKYGCSDGRECYWSSEIGGCRCQDPDACGWHLKDPDDAGSEYCGGDCPIGQVCGLGGNGYVTCECMRGILTV